MKNPRDQILYALSQGANLYPGAPDHHRIDFLTPIHRDYSDIPTSYVKQLEQLELITADGEGFYHLTDTGRNVLARQMKEEFPEWKRLDISTWQGIKKLDAFFQQRIKVHIKEYPDKADVYGLAGDRTGELFYRAGIGSLRYTKGFVASWHYNLHDVLRAITESIDSDIAVTLTSVTEANGIIRWIATIGITDEIGPTPAIAAMYAWLARTDLFQ